MAISNARRQWEVLQQQQSTLTGHAAATSAAGEFCSNKNLPSPGLQRADSFFVIVIQKKKYWVSYAINLYSLVILPHHNATATSAVGSSPVAVAYVTIL